jgi:hypothetical protein
MEETHIGDKLFDGFYTLSGSNHNYETNDAQTLAMMEKAHDCQT